MMGSIASSISSGSALASHALLGSETLPKDVAVLILFFHAALCVRESLFLYGNAILLLIKYLARHFSGRLSIRAIV